MGFRTFEGRSAQHILCELRVQLRRVSPCREFLLETLIVWRFTQKLSRERQKEVPRFFAQQQPSLVGVPFRQPQGELLRLFEVWCFAPI